MAAEENTFEVPEGFKPYRIDETFNDVIAPLYLKLDNGNPIIGMRIEKKHCNFGGIAHGGCLMTLMDVALSGAVSNAIGKYTTTPTININFDFIAPAREGDWIYADVLSIDLTRTMGFINAYIQGPGGRIARVSACYKLPRDINAYPGMSPDEYHQWRAVEPEDYMFNSTPFHEI